MKNARQYLRFAALAFVITFALYLKTVGYEFVSVDDYTYVTSNPHMEAGLTAENVKWAFCNPDYAANWHPLAWLSMMGDVSLMRAIGNVPEKWDDPANRMCHFMHLHNAVLHALNAALLFLLMAIVLSRLNYPALSPVWPLAFALLWSLHPLRTEVGCWISERKELVSVFFMLLSLICYCWCEKALNFAAALVFAALAMMAKPVAVTLPAVIVAWDWVILGKLRILRALPFAALSGFTCFMTMRAQTVAIDGGHQMELIKRFVSVFSAPVIYLKQTFCPVDLSLYYGNPPVDWLLLGLGIALVLIIAALCILWLIRRLRNSSLFSSHSSLFTFHSSLDIIVFTIAWAYVGLIPMLGIVKVAGEEHSDRYTYWVGCGLAVGAVMLLGWAKSHEQTVRAKLRELSESEKDEWPQLRKIALGVLACCLVVLAVAADRRICYWRNAETICRDAVAKSSSPDVVAAFSDLLIYKYKQNGLDEAEYWLRECFTRHKVPKVFLSLAKVLMMRPVERIPGIDSEPAYLESEMLLKSIPESDPGHEEAAKLLKTIEDYRKKMGDGK